MEKERLISFIATIMEDSGFDVTTNYPVNNQTIDIYGTLNTSVGEARVIAACKNYEEPWKVGLDILKDMEKISKTVGASKILIFTTSSFSHGAAVYAQKRNIKLVDKKGLMKIAQNYSKKQRIVADTDSDSGPDVDEDDFEYDEYYESNGRPASLNPNRGSNSHAIFSRRLSRNYRNSTSNQYQNSSYNQPKRYLSNGAIRTRNLSDTLSVNIVSLLEFFKEHQIAYLVVLVIIAALISFIFNKLTSGPYTGLGKIATSAIICYGGLLLVDRDLSDLLFKGSIIFFISIIISIITLTL